MNFFRDHYVFGTKIKLLNVESDEFYKKIFWNNKLAFFKILPSPQQKNSGTMDIAAIFYFSFLFFISIFFCYLTGKCQRRCTESNCELRLSLSASGDAKTLLSG